MFCAMKKSHEAEPYFESAVQLFEQAGLDDEVGRTLSSIEIDNLMYLSRYSGARSSGQGAPALWKKANDVLYLSILDIALGNLYYRLNRYGESLSHYDPGAEGARKLRTTSSRSPQSV